MYASVGLGIAIAMHLALVGLYYAIEFYFPTAQLIAKPRAWRPTIISIWQTREKEGAIAGGQRHLTPSATKLGIPVISLKPAAPDDISDASPVEVPFMPSETSGDRRGNGPGGNELVIGDDGAGDEGQDLSPYAASRQTAPVPVYQVKPEYPERARMASTEGTVWINCLISREGRVRKTELVRSYSELLTAAALAAAQRWIFRPAFMDTRPVEVWISIPFHFTLNK